MADYTLSYTGEEIDRRLALAGSVNKDAPTDISGLLAGDGGKIRAAVSGEDYPSTYAPYIPVSAPYVYMDQYPIHSLIALTGGGSQIVLFPATQNGKDFPIGATYTLFAEGAGAKTIAGNGAGIFAKNNYRAFETRYAVITAFYKGSSYWLLYGDLGETVSGK